MCGELSVLGWCDSVLGWCDTCVCGGVTVHWDGVLVYCGGTGVIRVWVWTVYLDGVIHV